MIKLKTDLADLLQEIATYRWDETKRSAAVAHAYQEAVTDELSLSQRLNLENRVAELLKEWGVEP